MKSSIKKRQHKKDLKYNIWTMPSSVWHKGLKKIKVPKKKLKNLKKKLSAMSVAKKNKLLHTTKRTSSKKPLFKKFYSKT